jgi:hypothetical protein
MSDDFLRFLSSLDIKKGSHYFDFHSTIHSGVSHNSVWSGHRCPTSPVALPLTAALNLDCGALPTPIGVGLLGPRTSRFWTRRSFDSHAFCSYRPVPLLLVPAVGRADLGLPEPPSRAYKKATTSCPNPHCHRLFLRPVNRHRRFSIRSPLLIVVVPFTTLSSSLFSSGGRVPPQCSSPTHRRAPLLRWGPSIATGETRLPVDASLWCLADYLSLPCGCAVPPQTPQGRPSPRPIAGKLPPVAQRASCVCALAASRRVVPGCALAAGRPVGLRAR